ncbi:hypothetical protein [Polyangium aurulentum]|uniref:hypothetical protein n=1 Tax=Polyangium aurulentum TaxID=2567896 RepID=UPI0010AE13BC|nr:hypothetical protein [Polyangium aurulentum]UQA62192.1 hypothetical protein E8A73_017680 [Polyangium aurulentum]
MSSTSSAGRGGWGRRAAVDEETPKNGASDSSVRARAAEVGAAIEGKISPVAERAARALESGMSTASRAFEDPATSAMAAELVAEAELPELGGEDALASLAKRLDRESDLFRGIAMRQLARAAWMDRLGVTGSAVSLVGVVVLAAIAGFRALFAPDGAPLVAVLLGVGAALLLAGAMALGRTTARIRTGQSEAAREALGRADLAEARLHRVAALMEMRRADPERYRTALGELERDIRTG